MSNMEQIPITFEILPRVVPNIPNIEVSIGKSVVEGYGRRPNRVHTPTQFNLFGFLWENDMPVSGGAKSDADLAKMTNAQKREYIKSASWYKRGIGAISAMSSDKLDALIKQHEKEATPTAPVSAPVPTEKKKRVYKKKISASEATGHENYNTSTSNIDVSTLETKAEKAIAQVYNNDTTKPPANIVLPDTNPLKTEAEAVETEEKELDTKATKGHIYEINDYDLAKWKHPKELAEDETMPVIVEEEDVMEMEYSANKLYYLPPLDPEGADVQALENWINRNRSNLKPNMDRPGLNEPDKPGKTYSHGTNLTKLGYIPASFGLKVKGQFEYEPTTPEAKAWLDNVKASKAYKDAEKSRVPHSAKLKVINDAWKAENTDGRLGKVASHYQPPDFVLKDKTKALIKEWNEVEEILDRIGRRINPLRYTSYQLNIDYFARRHTDGGNRGLSCIFAVGDYTPEEGSGLLVVNGRPVDIKYQPLLFNGVDNPHMVLQLTEDDKKNDRHRCSFVMFETRGREGIDEVPPAKNEPPPKKSISYVAPSKEDVKGRVYTDEEKKRLARSKVEMKKGWNPNLQEDVLPYVAKRRIHGDDWEKDVPYPPMSSSYADDGYFERLANAPALPYASVEGYGRPSKHMTQDRYEQICRNMEKCGLLHLMGSGVSNAINVPRDKVFSTKYEQDKIYVLPPFPKNDPLLKQLEQWMRENEIPINKSRANSGVGRSQTIGAVRQKFKTTYNDSAFTKAHPDLKKLLFDIGKKYDPLAFTSVQVNQNYEAKPHIDKNNIGLSMIFAIGDFKGGHLYINDVKYDIGHSPLIFNGAKNLHYVSKITSGDRFSFVYFRTGDKALREKVQKQEG